MSNALVIVESPAKAKTIAKYLGDGFDVRASVGHIADLPSKGLSVDVENSFKPNYELTERGATVIKDLKALLKNASALYLATDEDREGEAIAAHLQEYLKPKVPVHRMVFHEITKTAIEHALANPRRVDNKLVDAAEARRILDRLYGYEVSPILCARSTADSPLVACRAPQFASSSNAKKNAWPTLRRVTGTSRPSPRPSRSSPPP